MKTHLFKLECLTDLHVGNGEANYSIIDNEVQKDTVLEDVPVIHASGVKGALKDHFEKVEKWSEEKIRKVFGGIEKYETNEIDLVTKQKKKKSRTVEGQYKFFGAFCAARPLRVSDGSCPYILCTSEDVLEHLSELLFGLDFEGFYQYEQLEFNDQKFLSTDSLEIEGESTGILNNSSVKGFSKFGWDKFAVAKSLRDYALPVRARNALDDNGQSKNLWYEEIVPHKSIFYFVVITPDGECMLEFEAGKPVQFGGNASIGNGYTTIKEVILDE